MKKSIYNFWKLYGINVFAQASFEVRVCDWVFLAALWVGFAISSCFSKWDESTKSVKRNKLLRVNLKNGNYYSQTNYNAPIDASSIVYEAEASFCLSVLAMSTSMPTKLKRTN